MSTASAATAAERRHATASARSVRAALIAITAAALLLRLTSVSRSLFVDEAYSLALAERSFGHMIALFGFEPNGMPYSIMLWPLIRIFGSGAILLRSPAVLAGAASVPALWWTARQFGARSTLALVAAGLLAVNPMAVWYSETARPYAFVLLLAPLSFGSLIRALGPPNRRGSWVAYVAAMTGLAYSNLLAAPLALPAQALLVRRAGRPGLRRWVWSLLALLVACVPLLVATVVALGRRNALYWLPGLSRSLVELGVQEFTAGLSGVSAITWLTLLAGAVLAATAFWPMRHQGSRRRSMFIVSVTWGLLPGALLLAVSAVKPLFWPRYAILGLPGLCLLGALAAEEVWRCRPRHMVPMLCIATIIGSALTADAVQATVVQEEWRPIATWLREDRAPGQPTIVDKALVLPALGYYYPPFRAADGRLIVQEWHDRRLPAGFVGFKDPGGYGTVPDGPPSARVAARLARAGDSSLWLLFAKVDATLQGAPLASPAVRWAREHCRVQMQTSVGIQALHATECAVGAKP